MPATAASEEPRTKVNVMIAFTGMPMSGIANLSYEIARIAMPMMVFLNDELQNYKYEDRCDDDEELDSW